MSNIHITECAGFKMAVRAGSVDEQVLADTLQDDIFFKGVPEYKAKQDDIVIDVGAHIGAFSVLAAKRLSLSRIYAIEPSAESYDLLTKNIELNECKNILPFKIGLSDKKEEVSLFHDVEHGNWGHSIVKKFSNEYETITCDTLENFLTSNEIDRCDFIKFNCEGAEFRILMATPVQTLKKIETMLILYHSDLEQNFTVEGLVAHLKLGGFLIAKRFQFGERGWLIAHRSIPRHYFVLAKLWIKKKLKLN